MKRPISDQAGEIKELSNKSSTYVWVLTDDRAGNRTQAIGLADALGIDYEVKLLRFGIWSTLHNQLLGASSSGVDARDRHLLTPPWPQLVIAAGRRPAPVARWIKARSGGQTKIIQLGRKGGQNPRQFDATVTPAYTRLPPHPKRIETLGPLNRVSEKSLEEARSTENPFKRVRGPAIALLLGGTTSRHQFEPSDAIKLGEEVARAAEEIGGQLIAISSRRTGASATHALTEAIGTRGQVVPWRANDPANPFLACLAHADIIVVTGDSESMIAEAASAGKAAYIYPLKLKPGGLLTRWGVRAFQLAAEAREGNRALLPRICSAMVNSGLMRPLRNLNLMHTTLESRGYMKIFDGSLSDRPPAKKFEETKTVAETLRTMLKLDGV